MVESCLISAILAAGAFARSKFTGSCTVHRTESRTSIIEGLALRVERVTMAQYQSSPVRESGSEPY